MSQFVDELLRYASDALGYLKTYTNENVAIPISIGVIIGIAYVIHKQNNNNGPYDPTAPMWRKILGIYKNKRM
jgi:hypothetical protein